jgi:hypothetical protein
MSYQSEWSKKRYAENPEFRAKCRAASTAYQLSHKKEMAAQRLRKKQEDPVSCEKGRARGRRWQRKTRFKILYGITLEDYDVMLARQGGKCLICKRKPKKLLCVDHCHARKKIRGLLCLHCNSMLGFARDNPRTLEEGARYLRAFLRRLQRLSCD